MPDYPYTAMARGKKTKREPLDKDRILKAAVAFADENGVEALTMRKVADRLGNRVMSLYNHVANKDEMLFGMADAVAGEIALPTVDGDWKAVISGYATAGHEVLLKHPWAANQWACRLPGPERTRYMESFLRVLTEAGLAPDLIYHGYHAVLVFVVGFTQQKIGYDLMFGSDFEQKANEFVETMSATFPYMADHARAHLECECDDDEFGIVLDLILDGIESANAKR